MPSAAQCGVAPDRALSGSVGRIAVLLILTAVMLPLTTAAVQVDNSTEKSAGQISSTTLDHTINDGERRMLTVTVSLLDTSTDKEATVTFDGTSMTEVANVADNSRVQVFRLMESDLSTGTGTIEVTIEQGQSNKVAIGAISYFGVGQSNPTDPVQSASGQGSSSSLTVSSEAGDMVMDGISTDKSISGSTTADQTERWIAEAESGKESGGSTAPGEAGEDETMSWSFSSGKYVHVAFNINKVPDQAPPNITIHDPVNATITDPTPWLNVTAADESNLDTWLYERDGNGTNITFTPNTTLQHLADGQHNVTVWANDTLGNMNSSFRAFTIDANPPETRRQRQNLTSATPAETVNLAAQVRDTVNLSHAVLATNETGAWRNKTGVYTSTQRFFSAGTWQWSNFTWSNTSISATTVGWKIWYNDTVGNWNVTDVGTLSVTPYQRGTMETYTVTRSSDKSFAPTRTIGRRLHVQNTPLHGFVGVRELRFGVRVHTEVSRTVSVVRELAGQLGYESGEAATTSYRRSFRSPVQSLARIGRVVEGTRQLVQEVDAITPLQRIVTVRRSVGAAITPVLQVSTVRDVVRLQTVPITVEPPVASRHLRPISISQSMRYRGLHERIVGAGRSIAPIIAVASRFGRLGRGGRSISDGVGVARTAGHGSALDRGAQLAIESIALPLRGGELGRTVRFAVSSSAVEHRVVTGLRDAVAVVGVVARVGRSVAVTRRHAETLAIEGKIERFSEAIRDPGTSIGFSSSLGVTKQLDRLLRVGYGVREGVGRIPAMGRVLAIPVRYGPSLARSTVSGRSDPVRIVYGAVEKRATDVGRWVDQLVAGDETVVTNRAVLRQVLYDVDAGIAILRGGALVRQVDGPVGVGAGTGLSVAVARVVDQVVLLDDPVARALSLDRENVFTVNGDIGASVDRRLGRMAQLSVTLVDGVDAIRRSGRVFRGDVTFTGSRERDVVSARRVGERTGVGTVFGRGLAQSRLSFESITAAVVSEDAGDLGRRLVSVIGLSGDVERLGTRLRGIDQVVVGEDAAGRIGSVTRVRSLDLTLADRADRDTGLARIRAAALSYGSAVAREPDMNRIIDDIADFDQAYRRGSTVGRLFDLDASVADALDVRAAASRSIIRPLAVTPGTAVLAGIGRDIGVRVEAAADATRRLTLLQEFTSVIEAGEAVIDGRTVGRQTRTAVSADSAVRFLQGLDRLAAQSVGVVSGQDRLLVGGRGEQLLISAFDAQGRIVTVQRQVADLFRVVQPVRRLGEGQRLLATAVRAEGSTAQSRGIGRTVVSFVGPRFVTERRTVSFRKVVEALQVVPAASEDGGIGRGVAASMAVVAVAGEAGRLERTVSVLLRTVAVQGSGLSLGRSQVQSVAVDAIVDRSGSFSVLAVTGARVGGGIGRLAESVRSERFVAEVGTLLGREAVVLRESASRLAFDPGVSSLEILSRRADTAIAGSTRAGRVFGGSRTVTNVVEVGIDAVRLEGLVRGTEIDIGPDTTIGRALAGGRTVIDSFRSGFVPARSAVRYRSLAGSFGVAFGPDIARSQSRRSVSRVDVDALRSSLGAFGRETGIEAVFGDVSSSLNRFERTSGTVAGMAASLSLERGIVRRSRQLFQVGTGRDRLLQTARSVRLPVAVGTGSRLQSLVDRSIGVPVSLRERVGRLGQAFRGPDETLALVEETTRLGTVVRRSRTGLGVGAIASRLDRVGRSVRLAPVLGLGLDQGSAVGRRNFQRVTLALADDRLVGGARRVQQVMGADDPVATIGRIVRSTFQQLGLRSSFSRPVSMFRAVDMSFDGFIAATRVGNTGREVTPAVIFGSREGGDTGLGRIVADLMGVNDGIESIVSLERSSISLVRISVPNDVESVFARDMRVVVEVLAAETRMLAVDRFVGHGVSIVAEPRRSEFISRLARISVGVEPFLGTVREQGRGIDALVRMRQALQTVTGSRRMVGGGIGIEMRAVRDVALLRRAATVLDVPTVLLEGRSFQRSLPTAMVMERRIGVVRFFSRGSTAMLAVDTVQDQRSLLLRAMSAGIGVGHSVDRGGVADRVIRQLVAPVVETVPVSDLRRDTGEAIVVVDRLFQTKSTLRGPETVIGYAVSPRRVAGVLRSVTGNIDLGDVPSTGFIGARAVSSRLQVIPGALLPHRNYVSVVQDVSVVGESERQAAIMESISEAIEPIDTVTALDRTIVTIIDRYLFSINIVSRFNGARRVDTALAAAMTSLESASYARVFDVLPAVSTGVRDRQVIARLEGLEILTVADVVRERAIGRLVSRQIGFTTGITGVVHAVRSVDQSFGTVPVSGSSDALARGMRLGIDVLQVPASSFAIARGTVTLGGVTLRIAGRRTADRLVRQPVSYMTGVQETAAVARTVRTMLRTFTRSGEMKVTERGVSSSIAVGELADVGSSIERAIKSRIAGDIRIRNVFRGGRTVMARLDVERGAVADRAIDSRASVAEVVDALSLTGRIPGYGRETGAVIDMVVDPGDLYTGSRGLVSRVTTDITAGRNQVVARAVSISIRAAGVSVERLSGFRTAAFSVAATTEQYLAVDVGRRSRTVTAVTASVYRTATVSRDAVERLITTTVGEERRLVGRLRALDIDVLDAGIRRLDGGRSTVTTLEAAIDDFVARDAARLSDQYIDILSEGRRGASNARATGYDIFAAIVTASRDRYRASLDQLVGVDDAVARRLVRSITVETPLTLLSDRERIETVARSLGQGFDLRAIVDDRPFVKKRIVQRITAVPAAERTIAGMRSLNIGFDVALSRERTVRVSRMVRQGIGFFDWLSNVVSGPGDGQGPGGGQGAGDGQGPGGGQDAGENIIYPEEQPPERREAPDLQLEPDELLKKVKPGETLPITFTVMNVGTGSGNFSIRIEGFRQFTFPDSRLLRLDAGEEARFEWEVRQTANLTSGVYTGAIVVSVQNQTSRLPLRLIIEAPVEKLMDVKMELDRENASESLEIKLNLFDLGDAPEYDVTIVTQVRDRDGRVVYEQRETRAIGTSLTIHKELKQELPPGNYTATVTALYGNKTATASKQFNVKTSPEREKLEEASLLVTVLGIVAVVLAVLLGLLLKIKRRLYRCPTCGDMYLSEQSLAEHRKEHTGADTSTTQVSVEEPARCEICGDSFTSERGLHIHQTKVHGGDTGEAAGEEVSRDESAGGYEDVEAIGDQIERLRDKLDRLDDEEGDG